MHALQSNTINATHIIENHIKVISPSIPLSMNSVLTYILADIKKEIEIIPPLSKRVPVLNFVHFLSEPVNIAFLKMEATIPPLENIHTNVGLTVNTDKILLQGCKRESNSIIKIIKALCMFSMFQSVEAPCLRGSSPALNSLGISTKPTLSDCINENVLGEMQIQKQRIVAKELGNFYSNPISDIAQIAALLSKESKLQSHLSNEDFKFELYISNSGVPVLLEHRVDRDSNYKSFIPHEAAYSALVTIDEFMGSIKQEARDRIINSQLIVRIMDKALGLKDYSGHYRQVMREDFTLNQIDISVNGILPPLTTGAPCNNENGLKPATSKNNILIHELTHVLQALLPYNDISSGKIKNWGMLVDYPPHIEKALKTMSIYQLPKEDKLLAINIQFNKNVAEAFKAAQNNPKYKEMISPDARHGDYQMQKPCNENHYWITSGAEYFAELVSGAFGSNLEYAMPTKANGLQGYNGRISSAEWIKQNDPLGWVLLTSTFRHLTTSYCTRPLLNEMPFCAERALLI
ncbi:MAG: hypothetical protein H0X29_08170 [Parachlamydiaceae bacterium]|nr:hypothetical protein [Parachlamydiaceae bacterium]